MLEGNFRDSPDAQDFLLDGGRTQDSERVANAFLDFFKGKVEDLSQNQEPYSWVRSEEHLVFSEEEVYGVVNSVKRKMCTGPDDVMMLTIRDSLPGIVRELTHFMNLVSKNGMPSSWKTAKIYPLHKKDSKELISNYRPIANLQSISKIFEKLILHKIDNMLPDEEGRHQHGFRKNKSTTTALLELQDAIATGMDSGKHTACYSLDMSAAFDLLRPHIFHQITSIPPCLMNPIMDLLTSRKLFVKYDTATSRLEGINVGCVQGSVLGPKLFALYCKDLAVNLPNDVHITSYADDTYVTICSDNMEELKEKIQDTLNLHEKFLESIGMVVNKSKTELIVFNKKDPPILELANGVKARESIKALGLTITYNLNWEPHLSKTIAKTSHIINKVRFLRRWIDQDSAMKVITSQYFGTVYYGAAVWLTSQLNSTSWKKLYSSHYRALRAAIGDYKRKIPKAVLDIISKRATPKQWANYTTASMAIKLYNGNETRLGELLRKQCYINDRQPRRGIFFDNSKRKVGKQCFANRLHLFSDVNFNWIGSFKDDYVRQNLKKTFIIQH